MISALSQLDSVVRCIERGEDHPPKPIALEIAHQRFARKEAYA
jgi:hypothetical protein